MATVLFGGTFDPLHHGHLAMLKAVLDISDIQKIMLIPNNRPVHKQAPLFKAKERLAMLIASLPMLPNRKINPVRYGVSTHELYKDTPSWTVETVSYLSKKESQPLYFLMGSDSFWSFHTWKAPQDILKYLTIIVARRDMQPRSVYDAYIQTHFPDFVSRFIFLDNACVEIASKEIRSALQNNVSIEAWVPHAVYRYIQASLGGTR